PVAVGQAIKGRHAGAGSTAFDGLDNNLAVERNLAQVRPIRHLAVHFAAIARPAMAGLAVGLLQEQLATRGDVLRGLRERARAASKRCDHGQRGKPSPHGPGPHEPYPHDTLAGSRSWHLCSSTLKAYYLGACYQAGSQGGSGAESMLLCGPLSAG